MEMNLQRSTEMARVRGQESITPQLLQLIKWSDSYGQMRDLRLYDELSIVWTDVADLIGLDFQTSGQIKALHQGNPRNCVKDVIKKWKKDETALNSHYSCTWNGLCFLLEDTKLSTASKNLKEALAADVSSFQGNLNSGLDASGGSLQSTNLGASGGGASGWGSTAAGMGTPWHPGMSAGTPQHPGKSEVDGAPEPNPGTAKTELSPTKSVMPDHPAYHGPLTGQDAEKILLEEGEICYLFRHSKNSNKYFLAVVDSAKQVQHLEMDIDKDEPRFSLRGTGKKFRSIPELIDYYQSKPLSSTIRKLGMPCCPSRYKHPSFWM